MEVRLLGPLVVGQNDLAAALTARKPRTMFALLLLNESMMVPAAVLAEEVWGSAPPRSAHTTVQTYILQLRKMLAAVTGRTLTEVASDLLQTEGNGYRFVAPPGRFDLNVYRELELAGVMALTEGDLRSALHAFRKALRLWRGPVLADVKPGRLIEAEIARLEQSRMTMLDYRIELELRLGLHREILGELNVLVSRYPFHEDLHAQYLIALYRSGQRDCALAIYRRLRASMIDKLGIEPSPKLTMLNRALLEHDPALAELSVVPLPRSPEPVSVGGYL